jgi:hypothetical protein
MPPDRLSRAARRIRASIGHAGMAETRAALAGIVHALKPSRWVRDRLGIVPDDWQAALLDAGPGEDLMVAGRQSGKSTACAWLCAHTLVHNPGEVVVVGAPSLRQSSEMTRKVREVLETAGEKLLVSNAFSLETRNRARLVAVPGGEEGTAARGFTATMLVFDEAAYISDAVLQALRPMVATRPKARIVAIGSAGAASGWFYEQWASPAPHTRKHSITASMIARIDPAFLAREKAILGERRFRQEFFNEFAVNGASPFSAEAIERLFGGLADDPVTLDPDPVVSRAPAIRARL